MGDAKYTILIFCKGVDYPLSWYEGNNKKDLVIHAKKYFKAKDPDWGTDVVRYELYRSDNDEVIIQAGRFYK